ncbi:hypothetical protein [Saccharothrix syringae]|uniref:Uncharacterized protein n=1 Tax=Saccharothrix syringae TaxID=103733 RepID=A0A5Q0H0N9_SACSY|nr:hypothetical protein [Saccharothrix syringae]QFZ19807.1 hypothetical protein EKG83_22370 [Saccharothrix syringae]
MPEVVLRTGLHPTHPEALALAVVIDPQGSPGERAVALVGDYCYVDEEDGVAYILQTDAWAEGRVEDGVLVVDILVYPPVPEGHSAKIAELINEINFPDRSPHAPDAVRVLRVTGTTTHDTVPDETLVFLTPLDRLTADDMPLLFAPPPGTD